MVLDLEDFILFLFLFGLTVLFYFGLVGGFIPNATKKLEALFCDPVPPKESTFTKHS